MAYWELKIASMSKTVFFKSVLLSVLFFGCSQPESLPFYNSPDFKPLFLNARDAQKEVTHTIASFAFKNHVSPYMLMVKKIQEKIKLNVPQGYWKLNYWEKLYTNRSKLQSITHVDFSARIQTVSKKTNPKYWGLINEFKKITNVGVLVNTSFNVRGEPIVNSPEDAFKCFMNTEMDVLVIENFLYIKKDQTTKIDKQQFKND
jgi:carbamoyltransferase